ncbi:hypothetical protein MKX01_002568 [Papaver californicum]|nr:hypothetical protein MKX01_002568 [Papaver californicum]
MAMKMDNGKQLLEKIKTAAWDAVQGAVEANNLSDWDINFWSERLRESKYDINEEELRLYFSLPKFNDMKRFRR